MTRPAGLLRIVRHGRSETLPREKHGQIVWGILLIANGVLLLIGRLGLADIHITAHLWPILPLTLGALRLIRIRRSRPMAEPAAAVRPSGWCSSAAGGW